MSLFIFFESVGVGCFLPVSTFDIDCEILILSTILDWLNFRIFAEHTKHDRMVETIPSSGVSEKTFINVLQMCFNIKRIQIFY